MLPRFRKTTTIKFWSLRDEISEGLGVIHDVDTYITRYCYRVKVKENNSWKWQICAYNQLLRHDGYVDTDQEILDDSGEDLKCEIL